MIRRFLTRVLMVILIGVCGYNGWQIHLMHEDIARLQAEVATAHRHTDRTAGIIASDSEASQPAQSWLDRAQRHAERAQAALARADFGTAQREITGGMDDLRRAAQEPEAKTQAALQEARRTLQLLQTQADALWRKTQGTTAPVQKRVHHASQTLP